MIPATIPNEIATVPANQIWGTRADFELSVPR